MAQGSSYRDSLMDSQAPYSSLAPYYHLLMEHVDYKKWARYLHRLWAFCDHQPNSLLELAGGDLALAPFLSLPTSTLRIHTDLAQEMLNQSPSNYSKVAVDMRQLPFGDSKFDTLICLYDSVNYLQDDWDITDFLRESARVLQDSGLLIFDAVTPWTCMKYFQDYKDWVELPLGEGYLLRHAQLDADEGIQYNRFKWIRNGSVHVQECHIQVIRFLEEWIELIGQQKNFELVGVFGGFGLKPAQERSERWQFVLRRCQ